MQRLTKLLFIYFSTIGTIFSQEKTDSLEIKKNTVYFELRGQGIVNSITYDHLFRTDKKVKTSVSAGLTFGPLFGLPLCAVPISYNFLFGKKQHYLELGIGLTSMYFRDVNTPAIVNSTGVNGVNYVDTIIGYKNDFFFYATPKIGYRFQKPEGGLFFRATFTPPIAGFLKYGDLNNGDLVIHNGSTESFVNTIFWGKYAKPWGGISIGWTKKNKPVIVIPEEDPEL